jgi:hypothetical protein
MQVETPNLNKLLAEKQNQKLKAEATSELVKIIAVDHAFFPAFASLVEDVLRKCLRDPEGLSDKHHQQLILEALKNMVQRHFREVQFVTQGPYKEYIDKKSVAAVLTPYVALRHLEHLVTEILLHPQMRNRQTANNLGVHIDELKAAEIAKYAAFGLSIELAKAA